MITLEQKKQLQFDAGIPHLPTDLTYECRMAISGEGERAYEWRDKPHRLVYDLSRQVEADADRIKQLEAKLIIAVAYIRRHIPDSIYEQRQQARSVLAKLEVKDE